MEEDVKDSSRFPTSGSKFSGTPPVRNTPEIAISETKDSFP